MTKPTLPNFNGPYPQYNSVFFNPDDEPMGQIQSLQWSSTAQTTEVGRIGSKNKKTLPGSVTHTATVALWEDESLEEIYQMMGGSGTPTSGDKIEMSVDAAEQLWLIRNYDGEASGSTLLSTIYFYNTKPTSLQGGRAVDGNNVITINLGIEDLYWIVA